VRIQRRFKLCSTKISSHTLSLQPRSKIEKGALRSKAIGETDPIYTDEAAARDAGHRSLPVPPTFLHCLESQASDPNELIAIAGRDLGRILHAEQQVTYHAMAHARDRLNFEPKIADVYSKKGGASISWSRNRA
jgi:hypothetical protein